jgi:hypothetical protein
MIGNKRKYILIGLFAITTVYLLYNIFLVDASYYEDIPRKVRHLSRLLSIIFVYGIGYYSFKNYGEKWIIDIWNIIYFAVIPLLILIGIYDLSLGPASVELRNISKTLHEFLISPVFYVTILIVKKTLGRLNATEEQKIY